MPSSLCARAVPAVVIAAVLGACAPRPARMAAAAPPAPAPESAAPVPAAPVADAPAPAAPAPVAAAPSVDVPADPVFTSSVRPVLLRHCVPCHEPGGQMYARMPFDDPRTLRAHREGVLRRLKVPDEKAVVEAWLGPN